MALVPAGGCHHSPTPYHGAMATEGDDSRDRPRDPALARIRVVLVRPQGPRNVGGVARSMLNFGLSRLVLVGGVAPDDPQAKEAAVTAGPLLAGARRCASLAEAIADCTFVVGTSARSRRRIPTLTPREAAPRILEEAARGEVALLFGQEDHGMSASDLCTAHEIVAVPTAPACRALNLSHAAGLLAYEVFAASEALDRRAGRAPGRLVDRALAALLRESLREALELLGVLNPGTALATERSLDRILSLGPMQTRDARTLFRLAERVKSWATMIDELRGEIARGSAPGGPPSP